jgi:hypothetical protein
MKIRMDSLQIVDGTGIEDKGLSVQANPPRKPLAWPIAGLADEVGRQAMRRGQDKRISRRIPEKDRAADAVNERGDDGHRAVEDAPQVKVPGEHLGEAAQRLVPT